MAYTAIDNPELYFQAKIYTGDGSTPSITLDGDTDMQPDMVWIKNRDQTDSHCLFDSVRTATEVLHSDATTAETTDADTLTSFDSDGFALGADVKVNTDTEAYVAWCWKESATAGFDIVSYTGTGSAKTEAHSLSAVPHVMIVRNRPSNDGSWQVYHQKNTAAPETDVLQLQLSNPTEDSAIYWNDTAPTSSVFSVGTHLTVNEDGSAMIAWLFSEKQGFSKFGSYTGNGSTDGAFIYTGFKPSFVMTKGNIDSGLNWFMADNKRHSVAPASGGTNYNPIDRQLYANLTNADDTNADIDFLSNGFKWLRGGGDINHSGRNYVYMAFAEAPFVNSNGVPCNAR